MRMIGSALVGLVVLASAGIAAGQNNGASGKQAAGKDSERLICRRIQETGSLGQGRRQCYTRAQWDRIAQTQRENSPGMTAMSGGTSGN
jgi:hypothetical protein